MNGAKEDPLKAVLDLTNGQGADVVVNMAGSADSVNLCTAAVKHNGIMFFYSWITQEIIVNISRWHNNSLEVINTGLVHHGITRRTLWTPMALRPVMQGHLDIEPLITHRFSISRRPSPSRQTTRRRSRCSSNLSRNSSRRAFGSGR